MTNPLLTCMSCIYSWSHFQDAEYLDIHLQIYQDWKWVPSLLVPGTSESIHSTNTYALLNWKTDLLSPAFFSLFWFVHATWDAKPGGMAPTQREGSTEVSVDHYSWLFQCVDLFNPHYTSKSRLWYTKSHSFIKSFEKNWVFLPYIQIRKWRYIVQSGNGLKVSLWVVTDSRLYSSSLV